MNPVTILAPKQLFIKTDDKLVFQSYQTIQDSLLINNPDNYDVSYHSLADALHNHLDKDDNIELERILRRLQQLSEKSIVEIQNKSKNLLK